jgi:hypothetical protein
MLLALLCLVWLAWAWSHGRSFPSQSAAVTARVQRLLKPRTQILSLLPSADDRSRHPVGAPARDKGFANSSSVEIEFSASRRTKE